MENIQNNITLIKDLAEKYANCMESYDEIVENCKNVVFTKDKKSSLSLYGMFIPDDKMTPLIGNYEGRIIKDESKRDFKYYFDNNNRIIMTERYSKGSIIDILFYYYYDDHIDIVRYLYYKNVLYSVGRIEYVDGKISRFIESHDLYFEVSYEELVFNKDDDTTVQQNTYWDIIGIKKFRTKSIQIRKK
ncbi:MAG: hypothetical protein MR485_01510 [Mollicutes bacterium]|nr:hypothetical protein [Mollicutes bacterium]